MIGMIELTNNKTSDIGVDPATAPVNHNYKPFLKVTVRAVDEQRRSSSSSATSTSACPSRRTS